MSICTFFGHRDCPASVAPRLQAVLIDLIESHAVDTFYVGNQGAFDALVRSALQKLSQEYPHIRYTIVLAYLPQKKTDFLLQNFSDTMLPEGIETVPKRFAISWRNKWMVKHTDFVVTYVTHSWGGAAQFAEMAKRRGKTVINLPSLSI